MNKNYIIAFLVVIVAAGAFFYFREQKTSEETKKIQSEAFEKLTDIAKKVPQIGLTQMASALEKYHTKNKQYPAQLQALYPEYMPSQQFIDEIEWHYELRENNFFLSKTVVQGKQQVVASIDKSMNPQIASGMEAASAAKRVKAEKETEDTAEKMSPVLALKPIETIQPIELPAMATPEPESMVEQPEVVSMVEGEIGHGIASDISKKLLVWRDKNGVLGFGNVIYPATQQLTIYQDGNWIHIKNPEPQEPMPVDSAPPSAGLKKEPESIATDYSKKYLVWKDKKGNIGYGNVQYPPMDHIAYICVNGNWQKVIN